MVKVSQEINETNGVTSFTFECNSSDDHEILDNLRVAILGDHPRRGMYESSNKLVIEVKVPLS